MEIANKEISMFILIFKQKCNSYGITKNFEVLKIDYTIPPYAIDNTLRNMYGWNSEMSKAQRKITWSNITKSSCK